jgi:hypothetical protein
MNLLKQVRRESIKIDINPLVRMNSKEIFAETSVFYPIIVMPYKDSYLLIDGYRRYRTLYAQDKETLEVLCLPEELSACQAFELSIAYNHDHLSDMDWTHCLREAHLRWGVSSESFYPDQKRFWRIACDERVDLHILSEESLKISHVESLMNLPDSDQEVFSLCLRLIQETGMNTNEWKGLLAYLIDLSKRDQMNLKEIILALDLEPLLDTEQNSRVKYRTIFKKVREARFPARIAAQKEIDQMKKALKCPEEASLDLPENLEGDALEVLLRIKNKQDLEDLLRWLESRKEQINDLCKWL